MSISTRSLVHIALYAALVGALGLFPRIDIPVAGGVPITAQTLGVMMAGIMLGAWRGGLALVLFLIAVAVGLPLLAGGRGGLGVFFGPSVGFLIGWPLGAFVAGLIMERTRRWGVFPAAFTAAILGGIVAVYAIGVPMLAYKTDMTLGQAFLASAVFLPGDTLKALIAGLVADFLARGYPSALMSRSAPSRP
ncbi:biotin transporter BioY [Kaustia mangrovi]|uniref:Biotin transporter n=1 Tax=Kaustia mangrovi TaxID=2593653 RepID=A0A7S8HDP7_9HYPH|nr:biotin transporter BioY [Kaustia mangrovi]QPC44714.1 biotin transporter BioY [Kaustia mangrovi]